MQTTTGISYRADGDERKSDRIVESGIVRSNDAQSAKNRLGPGDSKDRQADFQGRRCCSCRVGFVFYLDFCIHVVEIEPSAIQTRI